MANTFDKGNLSAGINKIVFRPGAADAENGNVYNDFDTAFIAARTIVAGGVQAVDTFSPIAGAKEGPQVELLCDGAPNFSGVDLPVLSLFNTRPFLGNNSSKQTPFNSICCAAFTPTIFANNYCDEGF